MAAPLVQRFILDKADAERQIAALERQLAALNKPIDIPVDIETDQALDRLQRDIAQVDNQTIDVDVDVDGINRAENQMENLRQEVDQTGDEFTTLRRRADDAGDAVLRVGTGGVSAFTNLRGSFIGVAAGLAAFQGFQVLVEGAGDAIQAASNLAESLSKTNVVFGEFSDEIQTFAATGPEALGLSTQAALEATATFGNLFVALGLSQQAAADLSPDIIQLAADLASFNNIAVDEAVEKLRSGLVGEVEPLRTLGVNLNAAVVEAKALELGLTDSAGAVTEAGKVQARYALILEQTVTAQGDFARTADGVANTQRTLKAEFADLAAAVGEALLPAYQKILALGPSILAGFEDLVPVITALSTGFASAVPGVEGFADALQALSRVPTVLGALKELTDVPRDLALGLGLITAGQFDVGFNQIENAIRGLDNAADSFDIETIRTALVDSLQAGVDPVIALESALVRLARVDLNTEEFRDIAAALFQISAVDTSQAFDMIAEIQKAGVEAGLSEDKIDALAVAVRALFGATSTGRAGRQPLSSGLELHLFEQQMERARAVTVDEGRALETLQQFADSTGQSLLTLLQNVDRLPPSLQATAAQVSASSVAFLEAVSRADEFAEGIRAIPEALGVAHRAFNDEAGEFEDDASDFIDRLIKKLTDQAEFESNLAALEGLGADLLAKLFRTEGIESAGLLDALLGSPDDIARGEAALEAEAVTAAQRAMDAFLATIEGVDFSAVPVESIEVPVVADLSAFLATLEGLPGVVDFSVTVPVVPGNGGGGTGGESGRTDLQEVNVLVEQNFLMEAQQNTATLRAAQEINSIVSYAQGRAV